MAEDPKISAELKRTLRDIDRTPKRQANVRKVAEALPGFRYSCGKVTTTNPASTDLKSTTKCQHRLHKEAEKCLHGLAIDTTCHECILSCAKCWDLFDSSSTYGPRPTTTKEK